MNLSAANEQKTPLAQSLQKLGRAKAQDAVLALGWGLPCTVAADPSVPGIVTVNFAVDATPAVLPQMTISVCKFSFINFPIKKGCIGLAGSADLRLGGLTGLGAGTPRLYDTVGNLSGLVFFPLGSTSEAFVDHDALDLYSNILCTPTELAFFGKTKVSQQPTDPAATDLPTVISLANSIKALLQAYGLSS